MTFESSPEIGALAKALPKAQAAIAKVSKDAANPHFSSRYASLTEIADAILPAMTGAGIAVLQPARFAEGQVQVATVLLHESGQWLSTTHCVPVSRPDAQGVGSALTYARRQGLQSLLVVAPQGEDDDGEGAVGRGAGRPPIPPSEPPRPTLADRTKRLEGTLSAVKTVRDLTRAWDNSKDLRAELEKADPAAAARVTALHDRRQGELIGGETAQILDEGGDPMIAQRTPEWFAQRLGKATASRIADITAKTKSGPSMLRANYAAELIAERLTGAKTAGYVNAAMQWGTDHEDAARALYADRVGAQVIEAEFMDHPEILWSGASPDGLVDDAGLVEIKCPNTATHLDALLGAPISGPHLIQMQWQMACSGRAWCDYVSFDPRLPPPMQLHARRVHRDVSQILDLKSEVARFLAEVAEKVDRLKGLYGEGLAA